MHSMGSSQVRSVCDPRLFAGFSAMLLDLGVEWGVRGFTGKLVQVRPRAWAGLLGTQPSRLSSLRSVQLKGPPGGPARSAGLSSAECQGGGGPVG